ncbi:branched-chain amino acid ABC transporter permease [Jiella sp. MQZ13P-4]|uniref:Branched-chain amino acid ABC transporter permease n=1 Tax=Jiella sonneratiae TaxID=2816856 RepID=A0ABS3J7S7_9HYPH|nr:branched-chain amino acid ABC transporter permease [Jiella sonneratiae]
MSEAAFDTAGRVGPGRRAGLFAGGGATLAAGLIFLALALLPPVATLIDDPFLVVTATRIMIFAIAALSLDLVLGYGAMVSFGHAAFLGIGAYAVAILAANGIDDLFLQAVAAILAAALFAFVTGAISLRTKGVYFIMITLAFGQMAYFFMVSLSAYGGDDGITLDARSTLFGLPVLAGDLGLFYLVLAVLVVAFAGLRALTLSRFGRVLRGTRENPVRMQAIGFAPFRYQLTAYVIAGALAGVAGVLLANQAEFVSPAYMSWQRSGELIVMVVLGGMGTLAGAIGGAIAFMLLEDWLALASEHWKLGLGLLLVLLVLFSRGGIAGAIGRLAGRSEA